MVHVHYMPLIPRPIPVPRQSQLGLMIIFRSASTGPRLRPKPKQMGSIPI